MQGTIQVTIHRAKSGYQLVQEQANKGKTPPQYEDNMTILCPVLDKQVKGVMAYKYGMPGNMLIVIFERLLQIESRNTVEFWKSVNDYYGSLLIRVPSTGLKLNIGTTPITVDRLIRQNDGKYELTPTIIEFPENPTEYIQYCCLLVHTSVAKNKLEVNKHEFYIEDNNIIIQKTIDDINTSKLAYGYYLNTDTADYEMYLYLLRGLGIKDRELEISNLSTITIETKSIILDRLVKAYPALYITCYNDENAKLKYYVELLVFHNLITRHGNEYYYLSDPIGNSVDLVIRWLKSPSSSEARLRLKQNLIEKMQETVDVNTIDSMLDSKTTKPKK